MAYKCDKPGCEKQFGTEERLARHKARHHGEAPASGAQMPEKKKPKAAKPGASAAGSAPGPAKAAENGKGPKAAELLPREKPRTHAVNFRAGDVLQRMADNIWQKQNVTPGEGRRKFVGELCEIANDVCGFEIVLPSKQVKVTNPWAGITILAAAMAGVVLIGAKLRDDSKVPENPAGPAPGNSSPVPGPPSVAAPAAKPAPAEKIPKPPDGAWNEWGGKGRPEG